MRSDLAWFVPAYWPDHVDHALDREWPDDLDLADAPPLVHELARTGRWLEQERAAIDARLAGELEALLTA